MHLNVRSVRLSASRLAASAAIAVGVHRAAPPRRRRRARRSRCSRCATRRRRRKRTPGPSPPPTRSDPRQASPARSPRRRCWPTTRQRLARVGHGSDQHQRRPDHRRPGRSSTRPRRASVGTDTFSYEISDASAQTHDRHRPRHGHRRRRGADGEHRRAADGAVVAGSVADRRFRGRQRRRRRRHVLRRRRADRATCCRRRSRPSWQTTLVTDGSHVLSAVARDAAGNTGTSAHR